LFLPSPDIKNTSDFIFTHYLILGVFPVVVLIKKKFFSGFIMKRG
jgi:hypothetical protein